MLLQNGGRTKKSRVQLVHSLHTRTHTHTNRKSHPFIKLLSSEEQRKRLAHVGCKQMYLQKTQLGCKFVVWSVKTFAVNTKLNLFCESTVGASNWMLFWCGYCQFYWAFIYFICLLCIWKRGITSSSGHPRGRWRNAADSQLPRWDLVNVDSPECPCQVSLPWKYIWVHRKALKSVFVGWSQGHVTNSAFQPAFKMPA